MSLADIIRSTIKTAHNVTYKGELQETARLERWIAYTDTGDKTFAPGLSCYVLVTYSSKRIRMPDGEEAVSTATIRFLNPIKKLSPVVEDRNEPVDERDKITLANGKSGPILRVDRGLTDPDTDRPYIATVYMG